ncbi:MAG: NAD(P)-dependent oxidoreductase [Sphingopyxis sp.]
MHSLPVFVRLSGRPVILLGHGEAAAAKRRLLERAGAVIVGEDAPAHGPGRPMLAIVALDDGDPAAAAQRLRARGLLVNVVDRPDLCDFTTPAIVDRAPVIIAIGTGGASAGLAKELRQRIERWLPPTLGQLAVALAAARGAVRARWPDGAERRRAIDAALTSGGPLDPLAPPEILAAPLAAPLADGAQTGAEPMQQAVARWLDGVRPNDGGQADGASRVAIIRLTSVDPDELTLRAARLLGQADVVVHPAAMPAALINRARADAQRCVGTTAPHPLPPGLTVIMEMPA